METEPKESPAVPKNVANQQGKAVLFDFKFPSAEKLIKYVGGVTSLLYFAGLLTVNVYCWRLGFADFTIWKPYYVITGTLVLGPCVLTGVGWVVGFICMPLPKKQAERTDHDSPLGMEPQWMKVARGCLFLLVAPGVFFLLQLSGRPPFWSQIWASAKLWFASFFVFVFALMFVLSLTDWVKGFDGVWGTPVPQWTKSVAVALCCLLFLIPSLILYLWLFIPTIYQRVPMHFGGGQARTVIIVPKSDASTAFVTLGLNGSTNSSSSEKVSLLFEGPSSFVCSNVNGRIVWVAKDLVGGVLNSNAK